MKLPQVDACVDRLHAEIVDPRAAADTLWAIVGPPTAGKSTALRRLQQRLAAEGDLISLLVAPPAGSLDVAPIAVVEIGGGLHDASLINGKLDVLLDPQRPWADKLRQLESCLHEHRERVVLLCDEVREWRPRGSDDDHWGAGVDGLASLLVDRLRCRRVITQDEADFRVVRAISIEPASEVESWLQDAGAWGELKVAASKLWSAAAPALPRRTPLEVRLLVAMAALDSVPRSAALAESASRLEIADELAARVDATDGRDAIRQTWATLALIRRSIPLNLLQGLLPQDPMARDVVLHCLLYELEGQYFLHDLLKQGTLCRRWVDDDDVLRRHRRLAKYFNGLSPASEVTTAALSSRMEALHHAAMALDPSEEFQTGLYFVEQLDAMARTFSLQGQFEIAATLYSKSVDLQPRDDYAHHYLAYNLQRLGRRPQDVEQHYQQAIAISPRHRWWWPRYILFLLLRGRELEARKAWREALDVLRVPGGEAGHEFYANLHARVLDLLLDRGLLEFAQEVLEGIPQGMRRVEPLATLRARYEALSEVREYGSYLPAPFVEPGWWLKDPPLLARRLRDDLVLEEWLACRVDGVESEAFFSVQAARVVVGQHGRPQAVAAEFSWDKLDMWSIGNVTSVAPGDFLIIGIYRHPGGQRHPRLHRFFLPPPVPSHWDDPWTGATIR